MEYVYNTVKTLVMLCIQVNPQSEMRSGGYPWYKMSTFCHFLGLLVFILRGFHPWMGAFYKNSLKKI